MATKYCKSCGKAFTPWRQISNQRFCSDPGCQRERRRRAQVARRVRNPDQKAMNAQYMRDWASKHPQYWKNYRAAHPEYVILNRAQQKVRNMARIANEAVWPRNGLSSGCFRLARLNPSGDAKEAGWLVELTVLSAFSLFDPRNCK